MRQNYVLQSEFTSKKKFPCACAHHARFLASKYAGLISKDRDWTGNLGCCFNWQRSRDDPPVICCDGPMDHSNCLFSLIFHRYVEYTLNYRYIPRIQLVWGISPRTQTWIQLDTERRCTMRIGETVSLPRIFRCHWGIFGSIWGFP